MEFVNILIYPFTLLKIDPIGWFDFHLNLELAVFCVKFCEHSKFQLLEVVRYVCIRSV
jgi:hypothetical protein